MSPRKQQHSRRQTAQACALLLVSALAAGCAETEAARQPLPSVSTAAGRPSPMSFALPDNSPRCGVEVAQDGSVGPITCQDGRVNAAVFAAILELSPRLFALPRASTWAATRAALCSDYLDGGTIPITSDAYEYRYLADHWSEFTDFPAPRDMSMQLMDGVICGVVDRPDL